MEVNYISYNYKDRKEPVAFLLKGLLTTLSSRMYYTYYERTNLLKEENPNNVSFEHATRRSSSIYCDSVGLATLESLSDVISLIMKTEVLPSYVYTRKYPKGSRLVSHKDRASCEISVTLSLFDSNPAATQNLYLSDKDQADSEPEDVVSVPMSTGDALVFFGSEETSDGLYHWRDTLESDFVLQSFLHYVRKEGNFNENAYEWLKK
jgi:hypothetical protein